MYDFKKTESEILDFWRKNSIFEKSLALRQAPSTRLRTGQGKKHFVFFEGPPTANGLPHIGHFLTRVYKDLYGRYKTMRGFFVLRKAGWDTHGLPVEIEIEKELGFKNKKDIEDYGIAKFNKKARESVWKYKKEWEEMTRKMGFWLDMKDPYVTYENNYIETLWYIIQQIWNKKLLYLAHKVVPYCARCGTSISSHEVAQGYKTVTDKSVYVKFKIKNPESLPAYQLTSLQPLFILAWTTTPWTLPGNVALAMGKDIEYVVVEQNDEYFILAKDLVEKVFNNTRYTIHDTQHKGSDLVGLEYEPIFDIPKLKSEKSYKVYDADFVSTKEGTGVVHTAVMYGEDDYELGTKLGLPKFHTVDEQGKFIGVSPVRSLARPPKADESRRDLGEATSNGMNKELDGKYVKSKETEGLVIRQLEIRNLLFKVEDFEHDYPFCWRCDSPLIYYAKSSWFIKMSAVKEQLLKNNQKINWFPEHIKEGRFGQWLKEGKDWAFSRERYWGTPLPIWKCQKCDNYKVIGSVAEMQKHATVATTKRNTYFILRHGYTTRDERKKMIISADPKADKYHLTSEGHKQVEQTAQFIQNNYKIDLIYSSPFIRTTETAEIVAKLTHVKVNKDDRLKEIVHGGCEGKSHGTCPFKDKKVAMDDKHHEMGESWNDVRLRVFDFINETESKYSGKNILIVSHGDPLWLLTEISLGATGKEIIAEIEDGRGHYPGPAQTQKLDWKLIPRNEHGELDLHRPFIDSVYLKCNECGASMKKIPDLIDVWFDSGAMPFAQWHWPFKIKNEKLKSKNEEVDSEKMFEDQFPADFIVEAIDQTRGWFYTLLAISTLLGKENPYKNVMVLGHTLDERGKKMSKSVGNVIRPNELIDIVGVDATRWYFYTANTLGESMVVSQKGAQERLKGFIFTLQNCVRFYELYSAENPKSEILNSKQNQKIQNSKPEKTSNLLDKWILSKLNGLVGEVSDALDKYDPTTAARVIEKFVVEDLSNWWLRRSRKRKEALGLFRFLLLELTKIIAPFTPFLAEDVHTRLHHGTKAGTDSVHLHDWPKVDKKFIDKKLEEEMNEVRNIVTAGLAVRKEKQLKVRQPLRSATIKRASKFSGDLDELVKEELNVKKLAYDNKQEAVVALDAELDQALIHEGYARELIRQIQDMRKEAKYHLDQKIHGQWHSDDGELSSAIHEWSEEIKKEALLKEFVSGPAGKKVYDVEKEFEIASGKKIWVGVRK
ncbi:MAG: class I tRNA ligase family protein [Candidatus Taylorbacteria bacterium]|nr:class I tRNA ligase family protein [Candidatus Taylorbacteria bacterium]